MASTYPDAPLRAHLALWLKAAGADTMTYETLQLFWTHFATIPHGDNSDTIAEAASAFIRTMRQADQHIEPVLLQQAIRTSVPNYVFRLATNSEVVETMQQPVTFGEKDVLGMLASDPRIYFTPPPPRAYMASEYNLHGKYSVPLMSLYNLATMLLGQYGLDTILTVIDGDIHYFGKRTTQNRKVLAPGLLVGLRESWDMRYSITFTLSMQVQAIQITILPSTNIPSNHYHQLPKTPKGIVSIEQTVLYPRNAVYGKEMVMLMNSWSVGPYCQHVIAEMTGKYTVDMYRNNGQLSPIRLEFQYDGMKCVISRYMSDDGTVQDTESLYTAIRIASYLHMLPHMAIPPKFDIIMSVTGYTYPPEFIAVREAQGFGANDAPSDVYTMVDGILTYVKNYPNPKKPPRVFVDRAKIREVSGMVQGEGLFIDPVTGVVSQSMYVMREDAATTTSTQYEERMEDFQEPYPQNINGKLRRQRWPLPYDQRHGYRKSYPDQTGTPVTRRIPGIGDSVNSAKTLTGYSSSSGVHAEFYTTRTMEIDGEHVPMHPQYSTSVLHVKSAQRYKDQRLLVAGRQLLRWSARFRKFVINQDDAVAYHELQGLAWYEQLNPYEVPGYMLGTAAVHTFTGHAVPPAEDTWDQVNDYQISVSDAQHSPDGVDVMVYYIAVVNLPGRPFYCVANTRHAKDTVHAVPLIVSWTSHVDGAVRMPMIKAVTKQDSDAPLSTSGSLVLRYATELKRSFRVMVPGSSKIVGYNDSILKMILTVPPKMFSGIFAAASYDDPKYPEGWQLFHARPKFNQDLLGYINPSNPYLFELWRTEGYGAVGIGPVTPLESRKYSSYSPYMQDAFDRIFGGTYFIFVTNHGTSPSDRKLPKNHPHRKRHFYLAHTARLWEPRESRYLDPRSNLSHATRGGNSYYMPTRSIHYEELFEQRVSTIPLNPLIPEGTKLIVFDDSGTPIACYDLYLVLIAEGTFMLPREVEYRLYTEIPELGRNITPGYGATPIIGRPTIADAPRVYDWIPRSKPGEWDGIYFAHTSHTLPRIYEGQSAIYLTNAQANYYTACTRRAIHTLTGAHFLGYRTDRPRAVSAMVPEFSTRTKATYRQYYRIAGLELEDDPQVMDQPMARLMRTIPFDSVMYQPRENIHAWSFTLVL